MPMKLFELKTEPQIKVEEEISQETDLNVQQRLSEASALRALSRLVAKDMRPMKPFQFQTTRSAELFNERNFQGAVYRGGK